MMTAIWIIAGAQVTQAVFLWHCWNGHERGYQLNKKHLDLYEQSIAEAHKQTYAEGVAVGRALAAKEAELSPNATQEDTK